MCEPYLTGKSSNDTKEKRSRHDEFVKTKPRPK